MSVPGAGPLIITTDAVGGVWSYSVALARGAVAAGRRCVLAVLGPAARPSQHEAVAKIAGCVLIETGLPLDWTVTQRGELDAMVNALIELARDAGCSAAHLHAPALAARAWPIPVVAVVHSCMATWWDAVRGGPSPAGIAWHRAATAEGLDAADAVIVPSRAFSATLQRVYRPARSMHVIHNGLPTAATRAFDRQKTVLAAGRLWDAGKNISMLDTAAAVLDLPVCAAGPNQGPDGSRATFNHLREIGDLTPAALRQWMAVTAIFAAPSLYEPFGLAVLEAAQQGMVLLLSDIPTFRELWSGAAVFVPADRPDAWAEAIARLADDPDGLEELGKAAALRAGTYTQDAMVRATMDVHCGIGHRAMRAA